MKLWDSRFFIFRKYSVITLLPAMLLYIFSTEICQAGTITYAYTYSADDELTSVTETQDSTQKVTNFVYDLNGNMTAVKDSSGNTLQSFSYNSLNQLIRYVDQAESRDFSYSYNAESLRSKKINASTNKYISFYYDSSGSVVNEADGTDMSAYLMAHDRLLRAIGTDIYWYVRNGKDIVGTTSDGAKQNNTYSYTAYGKDINLNSAGNSSSSNIQNSTSDMDLKDNPFKYSSTYQDFESGLYYMKARYYSPELMRFISKDTYDLSNKYAYGNGNPISNYDPSGHNALSFVLAIGALVTAAVSTILTFGAAAPSGIGMALAGIGLLSSAAGAITEGVKNGMNPGGFSDWSWKSEDTAGNVFNIIGMGFDVASIGFQAAAISKTVAGSKMSNPFKSAKYKDMSAIGGTTERHFDRVFSDGQVLGEGGFGKVVQYNGRVYKNYKESGLNNIETIAWGHWTNVKTDIDAREILTPEFVMKRNARVWNETYESMGMNNLASAKGHSVGKYNVVESAFVDGNTVSAIQAKEANAGFQKSMGRTMEDFMVKGNIKQLDDGRYVPMDMDLFVSTRKKSIYSRVFTEK